MVGAGHLCPYTECVVRAPGHSFREHRDVTQYPNPMLCSCYFIPPSWQVVFKCMSSYHQQLILSFIITRTISISHMNYDQMIICKAVGWRGGGYSNQVAALMLGAKVYMDTATCYFTLIAVQSKTDIVLLQKRPIGNTASLISDSDLTNFDLIL